jgi:DNA-binding beta-propeller fold protein YncE
VSLGQQPELQLVAKVPYPVAVAGLPDVGYYILTAENVVYRYIAADSGLQFSSRFPLDPPGDAIDIAFLHVDQEDSVVVTQWTDKVKLGFVNRYSPNGKLLSSWKTQHIPTGVDFDAVNRLVYFATVDSHELYKVDLRGGEPQFVCEIRGAIQLGPIALDVDRQLMYVADNQGAIFIVDLGSKKVKQLSSSFGLASALLFYRNHKVLYVADTVRKRIYAVDTSTPSQSNRVITQSPQLMGPSGIAPGRGDALLVTDSKSEKVFLAQIGPSGMGISQVPGPTKKAQELHPKR